MYMPLLRALSQHLRGLKWFREREAEASAKRRGHKLSCHRMMNDDSRYHSRITMRRDELFLITRVEIRANAERSVVGVDRGGQSDQNDLDLLTPALTTVALSSTTSRSHLLAALRHFRLLRNTCCLHGRARFGRHAWPMSDNTCQVTVCQYVCANICAIPVGRVFEVPSSYRLRKRVPRNHNPRVGGSSPSSATQKSSKSCPLFSISGSHSASLGASRCAVLVCFGP